MPFYRNQSRMPRCIPSADGNSKSVGGKAEVYVDKRTSMTAAFRRMLDKKVFRFIRDDLKEDPQTASGVPSEEQTPPTPPVDETPASDAPGQVPEDVTPMDVQPSDTEVTDDKSSGAAEPSPGEGVTKKKTRKKKKKRSS